MGARVRSWWQKTKLYSWWEKIRSGFGWLWKKIKQHPFIVAGIIVVLVALTAFVFAVINFGWGWTGFSGGESKTTISSTSKGVTTAIEILTGKTLWDWMQLLFIPIVLAVAGFWFNHRERKAAELRADNERKAAELRADNEREIEQRRAKAEQELALDNQQEEALQGFINELSELLLHEDLRVSKPDAEVRKIARVRTLTVLPGLDGKRQRSLLQFLYESGLIDKDNCIIDLNGADLSQAPLSGIKLSKANLGHTDLRDALLYEADLSNTNLSGADLSHAKLIDANLNEADLSHANLSDANLANANLIKANLYHVDLSLANLYDADLKNANMEHAFLLGANLTFADLSDANLTHATLGNLAMFHQKDADLTDANLNRANLTMANISDEQLHQVQSLKGAFNERGTIQL